MCVEFCKQVKMVRIAKYLSVCVIVLVSSKNIGATKLPEDCDYDEQSKQTGFSSSGSAQSSQFMMPDGSVLTSSKGSSISEDGIRRTFHELKKEANNYVWKTNEFTDGLQTKKISQFSGFPEIPFDPYFKKESYLSGQQSGSSSAKSESNGSFKYVGQQQLSEVPINSKVTTYEKKELQKKVFTSKGSSSYPNAPEELDINQIQGSNLNANANTYVNQPVSTTSVQNGYESHSQQKSENAEVAGSNVNLLPDTNQQKIVFDRRPVFVNVQQGYDSEHNLNNQGLRTADTSLNNPIILPAGDIKLRPSTLDGGESSSSSFQKFESFSQKQDANANIPVAFMNLKPNTFTTNLLSLNKNDEGIKHFFTQQIPRRAPVPQSENRENHYSTDINRNEQHAEEMKESKVSQNRVKFAASEKFDSTDEDGHASSTAEKVVVGAPHYDGRRVKYTIKIQAPAVDSVGSSQTVKQESHHSQSISSIGQTIPSNSGASSPVQGVWVPVVDETEAASSSQTNFDVHALNPLNVGKLPGYVSAERTDAAGYAFDGTSVDSMHIPILVRGEPQNFGVPTGAKSTSSSSKVSKSESHISESVGGSQIAKVGGDAVGFDSRGTLYDSASSLDHLNIPVTTYGAPKVVSNKQFSSSSSSRYFSSNGHGDSDQLVPNSDIYVRPGDADFLQNGHFSTYQKLNNANVNSDVELCTSCLPSSANSFTEPKITSYGFSKSFSSHSSNVNGKKTENREASVTVDNNGKIDKYHVKS